MRHAIIIVALLATGCTSTQHLYVDAPLDIEAYNASNRNVDAEVHFDDSGVIRTLHADSTYLNAYHLTVFMREERIELPLNQVHSVTVPAFDPDVTRPMGVGALAGAVMGATFGLAVGDPPSCDFICFYKPQLALALGGIAGLGGAVIGGISGAAGKRKHVVRFHLPTR